MQKYLPSTFQPALQTYTGSNLRADKPLCRPTPQISLVCQTKCNVFLPPKIIPTAYMESPRMGPNLPYKPATPNRKTSHTQSHKTSLPRISQSGKTSHTRTSQNRKTSHPHISQIRKTSHPHTSQIRKTSLPRTSQIRKTSLPRTTRSSLFPPYNNSRSAIWRVLTGTLPPLGSRLRPRVRVRLPGQTRCTEQGRYAGRQGRQEGREDSPTH